MTPDRTPAQKSPFAPIDEAIEAFRDGAMIIVVDDEDRENEGDLTIAAEKVTPEAINFMAQARPRPDLPADDRGAARRARSPADGRRRTPRSSSTAFCVSIEAKGVTSTGISAGRSRGDDPGGDRSARPGRRIWRGPGTCSRCGARRRRARARRADRGGGRSRAHRRAVSGRRHLRNHERRRHDGARAGADAFAKRHKLLMITIADLIQYRMRTEALVRRVASAALPTEHGDFRVIAFESVLDGETHVALVQGRDRRRRQRAGARPLALPDRRRLPLGALRLRPAARRGDGRGSPRRGAACCST